MKPRCLVTGANGHLGSNLIPTLLENNYQVRAGVRNPCAREIFEGMACEAVHADLLDPSSLAGALRGVDFLFQVAAVFKHWSKNSYKEIVQANITMTRNIMEAAAENQVKKIVYVSSVAALDHTIHPMTPTGWNRERRNPYYRAKTESEQLAFELADRYKIPMVSVLPAAIIGPNCLRELTPTMAALEAVLKNRMPFDPDFTINYVHVADVVDGMIAAMEKGRAGQRYILGCEEPGSLTQAFRVAHGNYPHVRVPGKPSKLFLKTLAGLMELMGMLTGKEPLMLRSQVEIYRRSDQRLDISGARADLGFSPRPAQKALEQAFAYLHEREKGSSTPFPS